MANAAHSLSETDYKELHNIIMQCCQQHGVTLIALELRGSARRRVVEVYIDKPEGVSLRECADVSNAIGSAIDRIPAFSSTYRLDVSSPGIDRPLVHTWQYIRNIGRILNIKLANGTTIKGRLSSADNAVLTLSEPYDSSQSHAHSTPVSRKIASPPLKQKFGGTTMLSFPLVIPYDTIKQATVELEM
ncbi:MAG: ribosome maturation factor RimP [Bacteroidota bacterium]|nr:ribosome maturation factor RimP [Candidatus Kapabacteria bacterium]MDW8219468.1 ribosome maturation factor RimP [Bacteroidota bacterium]